MRGHVTVIRIDYSVSSYHIISYSININIEPLQYSRSPLNPYPSVTTLSHGLSGIMGFEDVTMP